MSSRMDQILATRNTSYWANRNVFVLNLMLVVAQVSSYATGYDGSMMNGLQSLDTWQTYFGFPEGPLLGFFNCVQPVGQIVSFPIEAWISDRFGRRFGMICGASIILVGCILQGAAQNIGMFIAARFIIGFGLGINITAAPVYILETAFPAHRGPLTAVYNALWNVGSLVAAWVTYGTFAMGNDWSWRIPSILQCLASLIQITTVYMIPESPRWLVERVREDEAMQVLTKYHANGDPNDPLVELEMAEIVEAVALDREINKNTSYLTLFKTKANRSRTLVVIMIGIFSQTLGNGLISYYLALILTSIGYVEDQQQLMINGIIQAFSLVTSIALALIVNLFRRRTLWLTSTMGLLVTFVVWTIGEKLYEDSVTTDPDNPNDAAGKLVLACIFIYNFWFNVGWTPLQVVYSIEILPLSIRARGLAIYNLSVSLAGFFNQFVNPIGIQNITWRFYIVYDVWIAVALVFVYFFFKETQGLSLEESAMLWDGPDAVQDIQQRGEQVLRTPSSSDEKEKDVVSHVRHLA